MLLYGFYLLALVNALLWSRVFTHYYARWRERGNPESMAICISVVVMGGESFGRLWFLRGSVPYLVEAVSFTGVWMIAAFASIWSIRRARKRFRGTRASDV